MSLDFGTDLPSVGLGQQSVDAGRVAGILLRNVDHREQERGLELVGEVLLFYEGLDRAAFL